MNVTDNPFYSNDTHSIVVQQNVCCIVLKLKSVLSKVISPSFTASDDTVLQKLYDQICFSSKEGYLTQEQLTDILVPWLLHAVSQWNYISIDVKGFLLRVVGHVVKKTDGFSQLNKKNTLLSIHSFVKEDIESPKNGIILGYIEMVDNLINHDGGRQWIIVTAIWKEIVQFSVKNQSIYVKRKSRQLLSNLLITLTSNTSFVHTVITDILNFSGKQKQLINAYDIQNPCVMKKMKTIYPVENKQIKLNTYQLLSEILLSLMNAGFTTNNINELFGIYQIQDLVWTEVHNELDMDIILAASKLLCVWNISTISSSQKNENKLSEANFSILVSKHVNLLIIRHLFPKIILETCVEYSSLWHKYSEKFDREENTVDFTKAENLIFLLQGMPMFICMKSSSRLEKSEITELYVDKLFKVACPSIIRLCYSYRDQLRVSQESLEKFSCQVIHCFIRISSFCEKEQAVMIFQGFMHLLKHFVHPEPSNGSENSTICPDNLIRAFPDLLAALVNGLTCYLKKFKFSWRDSLETVCMMSFIQNLITNPDVPFLVCAETLKLAKLVLLHFMPPNLALLVNTLQGSSMTDLGNQLYKTLGSVHWEVRDSTLEVLEIIGSLAVDKFSAFQALLLENDLPNIILSVVEADCEPYVRASALSCLSELVKVQIIWDSYLNKEQVLSSFLSILYFETEGIVRNKAALLIRDICKYRTISVNILEWVYDTLYYVAQNDLHWEVKISALDFWDTIIEQSFISVGMVDGSFPDVIFSKEKKKIIKMTPNEMCTRVMYAVTTLSKKGCLQTLWETLNDNCDTQVQRKSGLISKKLIDVMNHFGIFSSIDDETATSFKKEKDIVNGNSSVQEENNVSMNESRSNINGPSHDDIIDEIVAVNDMGLLSGLVQFTEPAKTWPKIKRLSLSPTEFLLKIRSLNLNNYIKEPSHISNYSRILESLLDDILLFSRGANEEEINKNCIDCY